MGIKISFLAWKMNKKRWKMKKNKFQHCGLKTSRVSKACFPHLFSMSVSLISFSSQATGRSSNWRIVTLVFYLFEDGFAFLDHYYSPENRWFNELRSLTPQPSACESFTTLISGRRTFRQKTGTSSWVYCGGKTNLTSFLMKRKLTTERLNSVSASLTRSWTGFPGEAMYQHVFLMLFLNLWERWGNTPKNRWISLPNSESIKRMW